ncbi:tripeptidyl-peptidase II Tpp2 [Aphanomyces cochlioides]|nr:tripeptidyl-peptidase II Tpp2 [Aphanomyces cochlioides]
MTPAVKFSPSTEIVPKHETLASQLLQLYPEYDGRNTIVAIFDTGVDPGAPGLQITSDGKRKIIDVVDATGSSDVDMSTILKPTNDGTLVLPSGKVLTLNPEWKATEFRVGSKRAYELYPDQLADRISRERKEKWDIQQRETINAVQKELADWTAANKDSPSQATIDARKDIQARLAILEANAKSFQDPGPIYDCVAFFDGTHWRAAVDTTETGDFSTTPAFTNYRVAHEYGKFSDASQLNYALNLYDNGSVLSIVCDAGAHGTHVAGIVAGYDETDPINNGVVPGAQIVSVKIGDSRMGSMETGVGVTRGVLAVIENKCDVVNMSYGEFATKHDTGRVIDVIRDLVEKHGVTFVSSAGNSGPALGTVGAPGGSSSSILGVGAYVSPAMMQAEYSMRDTPASAVGLYTWSSRGPTYDGDIGVNVCAPGCAITSVPNWTLNKKMLMNGTSMSSPNCAGNVALLISGLKARNIEYNPFSIRRALENTAVSVPTADAFSQGRGLIQVLPALEYIFQYKNAFDGTKEFPLYYDVRVPAHDNNRGIYLREHSQLVENDFAVNVQPIFHKDARNDHRIQYEMQVRLVPTKPWISCAEHLTLMHQGRNFKVAVDSSSLPAGHAHYGEVIAYDAKNAARGPVFRIPVTVIKPEVIPENQEHKALQLVKELSSGDISRNFYKVPAGATWVNISVSRHGASPQEPERAIYALHLMQHELHERQSSTSLKRTFYLGSTEQVTHSFSVKGSVTLELCLAQYWNAMGTSKVHVEVDFRGIIPDERTVHLIGGAGSVKVNLFAQLRNESIEPSAVLNKWTQQLRPDSAVVSPLGSRDVFDDNRHVYQLVLTYSFEKVEEGKITPTLPLLNGRLYESPFESQLILIFDTNKKYIGCSDAYPRSTSLKKGKYVLRAQVRHEDPSILEGLKSMVAFVVHDIKDIAVTVYDSPNGPSLQGKALVAKSLKKGVYKPVYVGEPAFDKLPKGVAAGDTLSGKITYGRKSTDVKGSTQKPNGYPLTYTVPAKPATEKEPEVKPVEDVRDEDVLAEEAVRDFPMDEIAIQVGTHLPFLQTRLHHFDKDSSKRRESLKEIVEAAESIVGAIDTQALAAHYGVKLVPGDAQQAKIRKQRDDEKAALVDTLTRQARALGDLKDDAKFVQVFQKLHQWVDTDDNQYIYAALHNDLRQGHKGSALKRLQKVSELSVEELEKIIPLKEVQDLRVQLYSELGWTQWVEYEKKWKILNLPSSYMLF